MCTRTPITDATTRANAVKPNCPTKTATKPFLHHERLPALTPREGPLQGNRSGETAMKGPNLHVDVAQEFCLAAVEAVLSAKKTWWRSDTHSPQRTHDLQNPLNMGYLLDHGGAIACCDRPILHLSRSSGPVENASCRSHDNKRLSATFVTERQRAIQEAPSRARARFPLRACNIVHHDRCRPEVAVA